MMTPVTAARHFLIALAIGAGSGLLYGFLRPFRPRWLGDLLFVSGFFYGWLVLSFGVCRGDIRLGCCSGLFIGWWLCDRTVGRLFAPLFRKFWQLIAFFLLPIKNFFK